MRNCIFYITVLLLTSQSILVYADGVDYAEISELRWTVLHRNRILNTPGEEKRFLDTLLNYRDRAEGTAEGCDPRYLKVIKGVARPRYKDDLKKNCVRNKYPAPTNKTFKTRWNPIKHIYDPDYVGVNLKKLKSEVRIGLFKPDEPAPIGWRDDLGYSCNWTISKGQNSEQFVGQSCRHFITKLEPGVHKVWLEIFEGDDRKFRFPKEGTTDLTIRDHVIAVLGDSFGSGEGTPHTFRIDKSNNIFKFKSKPGPAKWLDPRCHRSLFASNGILTALLADKYKRDRFSLVSFACSGAESGEGMLKPYSGRETARQTNCDWRQAFGGLPQKGNRTELFLGVENLRNVARCITNTEDNPADNDIPEQVKQLKDALCDKQGKCEPPDLIIIYVGVNDIRFSKVVKELIKKCEPKECKEELGKGVDEGLNSLWENLVKIKKHLKSGHIAPENPNNVVLVTYPDPLFDERKTRKGDYRNCDGSSDQVNFMGTIGSLLSLGVTKESAVWARNNVLRKLNGCLKGAADEFGWSPADTELISHGHGYCAATQRWFQIWNESKNKQGIIAQDFVLNSGKTPGVKSGLVASGAMHPNIFGHWNVQSELMKIVPGLLGLDQAAGTNITKHQENEEKFEMPEFCKPNS